MWILSLSDRKNDLIYISEKSGFPTKELLPVIDIIIDKNIISLS
tara:strand:+ start:1560 stop:1691 length:132 start_codon:yes stop_codon:yes gene_type:complete